MQNFVEEKKQQRSIRGVHCTHRVSFVRLQFTRTSTCSICKISPSKIVTPHQTRCDIHKWSHPHIIPPGPLEHVSPQWSLCAKANFLQGDCKHYLVTANPVRAREGGSPTHAAGRVCGDVRCVQLVPWSQVRRFSQSHAKLHRKRISLGAMHIGLERFV